MKPRRASRASSTVPTPRTASFSAGQRAVADFVARRGLETDVAHRVLDAVSELGEVAKEVLRGSKYGKRPFVPTEAWRDELGDVLFSLVCVANSTGVDLDAALRDALAKYDRRLAAAGDAGSRAPDTPTKTTASSRAAAKHSAPRRRA